MSGSAYFSALDLSCSFNQVPIDPRDRDKTAFLTRRGQFRFQVMPQGAVNCPSVFFRLSQMVLRGLSPTCYAVYIDDTVVLGQSFEQAAANLELVLDRFRQANLRLKPSKCKLFQSEICFLGHIVSSQGVRVDPKKVACILEWPYPKNVAELRSYIGICSFYRSYVNNFSAIAEPLLGMLRKGNKVGWSRRLGSKLSTH